MLTTTLCFNLDFWVGCDQIKVGIQSTKVIKKQLSVIKTSRLCDFCPTDARPLILLTRKERENRNEVKLMKSQKREREIKESG